ncbi:M23 family metallopeptidase, partial [Streptomyces sp. AC558_RSS880]
KLSASFAQNGGMWASKHSGQDYAVPTGTPVMATHGGTVVKAGPNGAGDGPAYGNAVVIKHGNGTYSQYAHLSQVD